MPSQSIMDLSGVSTTTLATAIFSAVRLPLLLLIPLQQSIMT